MRKWRAFGILAVMVCTILMVSCTSGTNKTADTGNAKSGNQDTVTIKGFDEGDINITVDELKAMEQVTKDVVAVDSAGKNTDYKAKGPLFEEVLKKHGKSQKDLKAIRLEAGDGYSMEVPGDVLKNRDIILAVELNGQPLDEKTKPIRVVVPEERAMYWVKNVTAIEILKEAAKMDVSSIVMVDTAAKALSGKEFNYYGKTDRVFRAGELFEKYPAANGGDSIGIKAVDKLYKNEKKDIFEKAYIKYTGDHSPALVSDDMPLGMWVKNILWFSWGDTAYLSMEVGKTYFSSTNIEDKQGILLKDILKEAGVNSAGPYVLTGSDGFKAEVEGKYEDGGIVYLNDKGEVCTYFKDLPKNTSIKGLLSIEIKK